MDRIYCNPLPLPSIGQGMACRRKNVSPEAFMTGVKTDFREIADPELIRYRKKWYMYPSLSQVYVSEDLVHWSHVPLEIAGELGYAPAIVFFHGKFLLTSSPPPGAGKPLFFQAPTPLGPFIPLGEPRLRTGEALVPEMLDPAFFAEDGRLYLFWGCAPYGGGIYGVELDPENLCSALHDPVKVIDFRTRNVWEHYGEYNEHLHYGWNEGISVIRHRGVYLLEYACCGSNFKNYALACYRSTVSPLGPFIPPARPMAVSRFGMVSGIGHGGMVHDDAGNLWQFYTCSLHRLHIFERRIGMDRIHFDEDGEPRISITSVPQDISGVPLHWVPVSVGKGCRVSSYHEGHFGYYALDDCTHTWWEPERDDRRPWLTVNLAESFDLQAARIIWTEPDLDYENRRLPEPVSFLLEFLDRKGSIVAVNDDCACNRVDHDIEFLPFRKPVHARYVRLIILREKNNAHHGVSDFTLFAPPGGTAE